LIPASNETEVLPALNDTNATEVLPVILPGDANDTETNGTDVAPVINTPVINETEAISLLQFSGDSYILPAFCSFETDAYESICCSNARENGDIDSVCITLEEMNAFIAESENDFCTAMQSGATDCSGSELDLATCLGNDVQGFFEESNSLNIYGWLSFDKATEALLREDCATKVEGFSVLLADFQSAFELAFGDLAPSEVAPAGGN